MRWHPAAVARGEASRCCRSDEVALEVYDTFGPGMTRLDDPIEASIWNNKHFVWGRELSAADRDLSD